MRARTAPGSGSAAAAAHGAGSGRRRRAASRAERPREARAGPRGRKRRRNLLVVLRTAGRASHPATVRGAGRMRGGSRSGCSVSPQASGTFWHRRRAGRGNFLLPSLWSRSHGAVKGRWELAGSAGSPAPPGALCPGCARCPLPWGLWHPQPRSSLTAPAWRCPDSRAGPRS